MQDEAVALAVEPERHKAAGRLEDFCAILERDAALLGFRDGCFDVINAEVYAARFLPRRCRRLDDAECLAGRKRPFGADGKELEGRFESQKIGVESLRAIDILD